MTPNDDLKTKIQQVLTEKVAPLLEHDGGGVELVEVTDEGVVRVRLSGGCRGCPMAGLTMTMTVERILRQEVPEVTRVEPVD